MKLASGRAKQEFIPAHSNSGGLGLKSARSALSVRHANQAQAGNCRRLAVT